MGRHGVIAEIDDDTDTFAMIKTPAKSQVSPHRFGTYITTYRIAAQESWRRKLGTRARKFVREHPPLAKLLRSARSQLQHRKEQLRGLFS